MVRLMTRKKKKTMEDERARRVELEDRIIDTSNLNTPFEFDTQKEKRRQKQNTVNISDVMSEVRDGMGWDEYRTKILYTSKSIEVFERSYIKN